MTKITSYSVGDPAEEKPGLWFVVVGVGEQNYRLYFDVKGNTVQSYYESPELQAIFPAEGATYTFPEVVGKAYKILQDHVAQDGAPAYSFGYGVATKLIQRRFEDAAAGK